MKTADWKRRRVVLKWGLSLSLLLTIPTFEEYPKPEASNLSARVTDAAHMASRTILILEQHEEPVDDSSRIPITVFPVCTYLPEPEYPDSLREAGIEGDVVILVFISDNGTVQDVYAIQPSGWAILDKLAILSVWNSEWTPAMRNSGEGVGVWTSLICRFPP